MVWKNPPKFVASLPKAGKKITPESLAASGSEHAEQAALFAWAALNVGMYPQLAYMFAIPNGGLRDMRTAVTLKAEGVKSGVPDVFLPSPCGNYVHGCFIEMKLEKYRNRNNGGCSDDQIDFMKHATGAGYVCKVCYSWTEARDTLIAYLEGKL